MNSLATSVPKPAGFGMLAFGLLLGAYFALLTLVSGWNFTLDQFQQFWVYLVLLAGGFGLQVALYTRLRQLLQPKNGSRTVMATTGTTSTAAMISCCAHYLVNVAPVLGASGIVTLAAQYQVEFFWVGLAFNAAGIAYIGNKLWRASKDHSQCVHV